MTTSDNSQAWPDLKPTALLVLADGTVLEGFGLGAEGQAVGEVCFNTAMTGYEEILAYLKKTLGIEFGQTTPDNRFTLLPICCLGNCDNGPAMRINTDYHGRLTPDKVDAILAEYP